jgi:hypothetical protein
MKQKDKTKTDTEKMELLCGCRAGMKFCSRADSCSQFLCLIMLLCVGLVWLWVRDSIAYGDRDVCVSRVVDYSGLVMLRYGVL